MLEIKKDNLGRFLDLLILKNTVEFNQSVIKLDKAGLSFKSVLHSELGKNFAFSGNVKATFTGTEPLELGFTKLKELRQFISHFPEVVKIGVTKNKINFSSAGLKASYILAKDMDKITTKVAEEDFTKLKDRVLKFPKIKLSKSQVGKIVDYHKSITSEDLNIGIKNNTLVFNFDKDELNIEATFGMEEKIEDMEAMFPVMFIDCLSTINDDLEIYMNNKSPLGIIYKTKDISFNYFMAPCKKV